MQKLMKGKNGFTLAELLIVVAIVGVLSTVSIPVFSSQLEKAREVTDIANLRSAKAAAVSKYLADDLTDGVFYFDAQKGVLISSADLASNPISGYGKGTAKNGATGNSFETSAIANVIFSMSWVDTDGSSNEKADNYTSGIDVSNKIIKVVFGNGTTPGGGSGNPGGGSSDPIVVGSATFNDGVTLTWTELKDSANGTKYSYDASAITDTSIGDSAFRSCSSLTSVTIPNSVTSIGANAFEYCTNLTSVTIPSGVTSIRNHAFSGCTSLTSITIPNSTTSIGGAAFYGCSSLTSITIPDGLTSIERGVFQACTGLTSINIPDSVTNISDSAFQNCTSLTSITIPASVTSIGDSVFQGCTSLTSITIPNSITSIGNSAFRECRNLTSITIPDSVTSIGDEAFWDCSSLTSVTIGNGVTSIRGYFLSCSSLTSITIGNGVTSIDGGSFRSCSNLTDINYNGTKAEWNAITKGTNWAPNTGNYTIHCSDGDI